MSAQVFDSGVNPFRKWMKTNPNGYVMNTTGGGGSHYLMLHRSGCHHISGYTTMQSEGAFTKNGYIEVCSNKLSDIEAWMARLAHLLVELSKTEGVAEKQGIRLKVKLTHQEMANLIGCSRETVSSTLGQFRDEGLLQLDGRTMTILDLKGLSRLLG